MHNLESTMRRLTILLLALIGFLFCVDSSSFAAPPTTGPAATLVGTDTTTLGNWSGTYGTVGYYIPNGPSVTPSDGSTFNYGGASLYTWGANVSSTSALKTGTTTDIASCWYNYLGTSSPSVTLDVTVPAGQSQTVAVHFLDYDKQGRAESVSITDASNDTPPLSGPIAVSGTNFANGEYLIWTITGEVHINITLVTGPNAVASGIFFGENSAMPPPAAASAYIHKIPSTFVPTTITTIATLTLPTGNYFLHAIIDWNEANLVPAASISCAFYQHPQSLSLIVQPTYNSLLSQPANATATMVMEASLQLATPDTVLLLCGDDSSLDSNSAIYILPGSTFSAVPYLTINSQ